MQELPRRVIKIISIKDTFEFCHWFFIVCINNKKRINYNIVNTTYISKANKAHEIFTVEKIPNP